MNRYDRVNSAECTQAGNRRAEPINGAEGVLGWVIIPGDIAIRGGRQAEADPTSDNWYHANIVLPEVVASWQDTEVHTSWGKGNALRTPPFMCACSVPARQSMSSSSRKTTSLERSPSRASSSKIA